MKDFFANLIDRHRGRAPTVAPRAQAYFEGAPNAVNLKTEDHSRVYLQPQRDQSNPPAPGGRPVPDQQDSGAELSAVQVAVVQHPHPATGDPGGDQTDPRKSNDTAPEWHSGPQRFLSESQSARSSDRVEPSPGSGFTNESFRAPETPILPDAAAILDPNQRIDEMLRRLQHGYASPDSADVPGHSDHPETSGEAGRVNRQNHGDLEVPAWLNRGQPEFSLRDPEIEAHPEPIVNVTIGRVEIKALGKSITGAAPAKARPSGVMSLDEYLSKRQRKGAV